MKRFFVILVTLVCILGLSIPSFAYSEVSASSCDYLTYDEDGDFYALNTELKASELNDDERKYWKRFTDALMNKSDDNYIVFFTGTSFGFLVMSSDTTFENSSSGNYAVVRVPALGYRSQQGFLNITGEPSGSQYTSGPHASQFPSCTIIKTSFSPIPSKVSRIVDFNGKQLQIKDDIGDSEPEEPEEPDPPSSSSPSWIPPTVSDPVIPEGDEYVFYDTKILGLFLNHIRTQIVHAANVGWLIFGFILVWHVIKRVIKAFSSR